MQSHNSEPTSNHHGTTVYRKRDRKQHNQNLTHAEKESMYQDYGLICQQAVLRTETIGTLQDNYDENTVTLKKSRYQFRSRCFPMSRSRSHSPLMAELSLGLGLLVPV